MAHRFSLSVEDAKWETFKKYFLITHPNQTTNGLSPVSDDDWIADRILLFARGAYIKGLKQEFEKLNEPPIDMAIITQV